MKILILDNYDSFTYNLFQLVQRVSTGRDVQCDVVRNDKISIENCAPYDKFIFSPGPGLPPEAGILKDLIREYTGSKSMLGVCLGHQAIAEVFGGSLVNLNTVFHGVASTITLELEDYLFRDVGKTFDGGRYHSWVVSKEDFPEVLEPIAFDTNGEIMALRHRTLDIRGVQFHPESIMTPSGTQMIRNFIEA
jgi:anthranilate synthase component 2